MNSIQFFIPLKPVPKGRPRFWNGITVTDAQTRAYEIEIRRAVKKQYKGEALLGPLEVQVVFSFKKPKKPARPYPCRGDLDNFLKAILDACNKILWVDDVQITDVRARKKYSHEQGVFISVSEDSYFAAQNLDPGLG